MSQPPINDLNSLIEQASREVEQQTRKAPPAPTRPIAKTLFGIFLGGVLITLLFVVLSWFAKPTPAMIVHDLEVAVDTAQKAIEQAKKEKGALPDALPNASLASVVQYERDQDEYKLTSVIMGVRVTLESNGKKTTETGLK